MLAQVISGFDMKIYILVAERSKALGCGLSYCFGVCSNPAQSRDFFFIKQTRLCTSVAYNCILWITRYSPYIKIAIILNTEQIEMDKKI